MASSFIHQLGVPPCLLKGRCWSCCRSSPWLLCTSWSSTAPQHAPCPARPPGTLKPGSCRVLASRRSGGGVVADDHEVFMAIKIKGCDSMNESSKMTLVSLPVSLVEELVDFKLQFITSTIDAILARWNRTSIEQFLQDAKASILEEAEDDAMDLINLVDQREDLFRLKRSWVKD